MFYKEKNDLSRVYKHTALKKGGLGKADPEAAL
jgi:hypothetical protein